MVCAGAVSPALILRAQNVLSSPLLNQRIEESTHCARRMTMLLLETRRVHPLFQKPGFRVQGTPSSGRSHCLRAVLDATARFLSDHCFENRVESETELRYPLRFIFVRSRPLIFEDGTASAEVELRKQQT